MSRTPVLLANWKMNKGYKESIDWIAEAGKKVPPKDKVETVIFPIAPVLDKAVENQGENLRIGAQYFHYEDKGNFTGEIPASLLKEVGVKYGLIGHGERTFMYHDSHDDNNKRVKKAFENGIIPILQLGEETDPEEELLNTGLLYNEIFLELYKISKEEAEKVIIAFAPGWKAEYNTPENIQKYHKMIRHYYSKIFGADVAEKVRIIFGGGIKPENIEQFLAQPDIDGGEVTSSAFVLEKFLSMAESCAKKK